MHTTEKFFPQFCADVKEFLILFGLQDWSVTLTNDHLVDAKQGVMAQINPGNWRAQHVAINLELDWWGAYDEPNAAAIRNAALHEVLEVLVQPMRELIHQDISKDAHADAFSMEAHRLIHRVAHALGMPDIRVGSHKAGALGKQRSSDWVSSEPEAPVTGTGVAVSGVDYSKLFPFITKEPAEHPDAE